MFLIEHQICLRSLFDLAKLFIKALLIINNNNNNNCLKSNIQCIEIRVQWTVHLGSSHIILEQVTGY